MKILYIVGAGGFGREVLWMLERINKIKPTWKIEGFIDDDKSIHGVVINGYPVLGGCDYFSFIDEESWVVCSIGATKIKKAVVKKLSEYFNVKFATIIDPSVVMSKRVEIGEGCIICANTIITVDIKIGKHVIVNLDCTVGHDDVIGDYVTVYPSVNISGNVVVGELVELGTGTQVIQGKTIGEGSIIGAGAVVVKNIPEKCVAFGSPAKPIKYFE